MASLRIEEKEELNRNYQTQIEELRQSNQNQQQLEQSLKSEIQKLKQQLEQEKDRSEPQAKAIIAIELKSVKGIYYSKLRDLLVQQQWQEADEETTQVMLQAANREEEGYLNMEAIDNFPCEDLQIINQLWLYYSNGKFGFTVQKEIYESLGGTREYNPGIWEVFGDRVSWRKEGKWLNYSELIFDLTGSPDGHLPLFVITAVRSRLWNEEYCAYI